MVRDGTASVAAVSGPGENRAEALLRGIENRKVESVGRGADRWHLKRKGH
jgi:hypothetical protein